MMNKAKFTFQEKTGEYSTFISGDEFYIVYVGSFGEIKKIFRRDGFDVSGGEIVDVYNEIPQKIAPDFILRYRFPAHRIL